MLGSKDATPTFITTNCLLGRSIDDVRIKNAVLSRFRERSESISCVWQKNMDEAVNEVLLRTLNASFNNLKYLFYKDSQRL